MLNKNIQEPRCSLLGKTNQLEYRGVPRPSHLSLISCSFVMKRNKAWPHSTKEPEDSTAEKTNSP